MPRLPLRHSLTAACAALVAGAGLMAVTPAMATTPYLGWASKAATPQAPAAEPAPQRQPAQQAQQPQGRYGVPASPYGQVGYPFRTLAWSNKSGGERAPAQAQVEAQAEPPVQPISHRVPAPQMPATQMQAPAMKAAASAPPPPSQPRTITQNGRTYVLPRAPKGAIEPEDDPVYDDVVSVDAPPPAPPRAALSKPAPSRTAPQALRPSVQPDPAPLARIASVPATEVAPAAQARIAPAKPADDGAYQVPASSKYAARIAAARAAAVDSQPSPPVQPAPLLAEASAHPAAAMATAPAAGEPLAAQETDHVFIPGEQIRSAADEPRFYSLHRQYGYKPDPITVDHNATGAILEPGLDIQTSDDTDSDSPSKDGDAPAGDDPK